MFTAQEGRGASVAAAALLSDRGMLEGESLSAQRSAETLLFPDTYAEFLLNSVAAGRFSAHALRSHGSECHSECDWYHSAWPVLRVLDMVSNPGWHGSFFSNSIREYADRHPGRLSVLVVGTADGTIIDHIHSGLGTLAPERVKLDVVDICKTPLQSVRDFAEAREARSGVRTIVGDARELTMAGVKTETYDFIVTDAFLTRFNFEDKSRVMSQWAEVLKPGGQVITTVRLGKKTRTLADPGDVEEFKARAIERYLRLSMNDPRVRDIATTREVGDLAQTYAMRMSSNPIDVESLGPLFRCFGFKFTGADSSFERAMIGGEYEPTEYARIVAEKR